MFYLQFNWLYRSENQRDAVNFMNLKMIGSWNACWSKNRIRIDWFIQLYIRKWCWTTAGFVPPHKYENGLKVNNNLFNNMDVFYICNRCGKIYWEDSHHNQVKFNFKDEQTIVARRRTRWRSCCEPILMWIQWSCTKGLKS